MEAFLIYCSSLYCYEMTDTVLFTGLITMASSNVKLKRCGVRFDPPAVIVTYSVGSKVHRRTMPLRNFTKKTGITRTAQELKDNPRHKKYLAQVPLPQLEKLVTIIQDKMNGLSLQASLEKNKKLSMIDPEEDLNKVDEETLKRKKALMEQSFERNKKKPGDPDFEYDVEVDFEGGAIETCEWDSDNDDDEF